MAQQGQAGLVGPVEVLEDEHHRLVARREGQQPGNGGEQEVALGVGVIGLRRRKVDPAPREGGHEVGNRRTVLGDVRGQQLVGRMGNEVG